AFLNENPIYTQVELAEQLGVDRAAVSRRVHGAGKIQKLGKRVSHELSRSGITRRLSACVSL
ncbi:hypothetical protein EAI_10793, partial [Harpegnathos saltator]